MLRGVIRERLSFEEAEQYDRFVDQAPSGHLFQSRAWGRVLCAFRNVRVYHAMVYRGGDLIAAALIQRSRVGPLVTPWAQIERGPVLSDPSVTEPVLRFLRGMLLRRGCVRLEVMPYFAEGDVELVEQSLVRAGFKRTQEADGAHVRTLRVNLEGPLESLFAGKERESLRRKLRQAEKAGAVVRRGGISGLQTLEALYRVLMESQGMSPKPRAYFDALYTHIVGSEQRGTVFVCEHEGEPIAALFASVHGALATFVVGATASTPRPFSKMVLPMAEAIRWSKAMGCTAFDLGGIPMDGDTDDKRANIAQFKFDFAKAKVALVSAHTYVAFQQAGPR